MRNLHNEQIKLDVQLLLNDYLDFSLYTSKFYKSLTNYLISLCIFGIVIPAIEIIGHKDVQCYLSYVWIIGVSYGIIAYGIMYIKLSNYAKKSYKKFILEYKQKFEYIIDDSGIIVNYEVGNGMSSWNDIDKVGKSKHCFIIFFSGTGALIIPKRSFAAFEDIKVFLNIITRNTGKKISGILQ